MMKVEIGMMWPRTKNWQQPTEAARGREQILF